MATWKLTTAVALAILVVTGPAFAQATTGRRADEKVKAAQQALKDKGHDPGMVDGRMGPKTKAALRDFQKAQGIDATGRLDTKTMQSLGVDTGKTGSTGSSATGGSASPGASGAAEKK